MTIPSEGRDAAADAAIPTGALPQALALLAGVGVPDLEDAPAAICRCHRKEAPDDEEVALLTAALEMVPPFFQQLAKTATPSSFAEPLAYGGRGVSQNGQRRRRRCDARIFCGDESRRRRGCDARTFRGDESRRRSYDVDIPWRRVAAPPRLRRADIPRRRASRRRYGALTVEAPLSKELGYTLRSPGDDRVFSVRLRHPAIAAPPKRETALRARLEVVAKLPEVLRVSVAPRDGSAAGDAYASVADAAAYHRSKVASLPRGEARAGHEFALALALRCYRSEPPHREAMALCRRAISRGPSSPVAAAARALLEDLAAYTGDDADAFLEGGLALGKRPGVSP